MIEFMWHPFVQKILVGMGTGLGAALLMDYAELRKYRSWADAGAQFQLSVASWRWFNGAVGGGLSAIGIAGFDAMI
jgi:hypothetical protein